MPDRPVFRIGGRAIADGGRESANGKGDSGPSVSGGSGERDGRPSTPPAVALERTIRFPDDEERIQIAK
tara:strand:- start:96 stop:302 length:207 start_codon:yes stop_codon:yes gene_type:complete